MSKHRRAKSKIDSIFDECTTGNSLTFSSVEGLNSIANESISNNQAELLKLMAEDTATQLKLISDEQAEDGATD